MRLTGICCSKMLLFQKRFPWRILSASIARYSLVLKEPDQTRTRHLHCNNAASASRIDFYARVNSNHLHLQVWQNYLLSSKRTLSADSFIDESAYEDVADETLDVLAEKLEVFLDQLEDKSYDIVFNVSAASVGWIFRRLTIHFTSEWSHYLKPR